MTRFSSRLAAIFLVLGMITASATAATAQDTVPLVTIVASGEPEAQMMSMVLTTQAVKQGADAHILLCGPAGNLARNNPPASATDPQGPRGVSPRQLLEGLIEQGVGVDVCAIYLPNRDLDANVLMDGVGVAKPGPMARRLLQPDVRLLTF